MALHQLPSSINELFNNVQQIRAQQEQQEQRFRESQATSHAQFAELLNKMSLMSMTSVAGTGVGVMGSAVKAAPPVG